MALNPQMKVHPFSVVGTQSSKAQAIQGFMQTITQSALQLQELQLRKQAIQEQRQAQQFAQDKDQGSTDALLGKDIGPDPSQGRLQAYELLSGKTAANQFRGKALEYFELNKQLPPAELQAGLQGLLAREAQDLSGAEAQGFAAEAAPMLKSILDEHSKVLTENVRNDVLGKVRAASVEGVLNLGAAHANGSVKDIRKAAFDLYTSQVNEVKGIGVLSPIDARKQVLNSIVDYAITQGKPEMIEAFLPDDTGNLLTDASGNSPFKNESLTNFLIASHQQASATQRERLNNSDQVKLAKQASEANAKAFRFQILNLEADREQAEQQIYRDMPGVSEWEHKQLVDALMTEKHNEIRLNLVKAAIPGTTGELDLGTFNALKTELDRAASPEPRPNVSDKRVFQKLIEEARSGTLDLRDLSLMKDRLTGTDYRTILSDHRTAEDRKKSEAGTLIKEQRDSLRRHLSEGEDPILGNLIMKEGTAEVLDDWEDGVRALVPILATSIHDSELTSIQNCVVRIS